MHNHHLQSASHWQHCVNAHACHIDSVRLPRSVLFVELTQSLGSRLAQATVLTNSGHLTCSYTVIYPIIERNKCNSLWFKWNTIQSCRQAVCYCGDLVQLSFKLNSTPSFVSESSYYHNFDSFSFSFHLSSVRLIFAGFFLSILIIFCFKFYYLTSFSRIDSRDRFFVLYFINF